MTTSTDLPDHHKLPWRKTAAAPEPDPPQDTPPPLIPMPPSYPPSVGTTPATKPEDDHQPEQTTDAPQDNPQDAEPEQRPWWSARRKPSTSESSNAEDQEEEPENPAPTQLTKGRPRQDRIAAARVSWDAVPPKTKRLAYDLSAAAIGWGVGMVQWDAVLLAGSHAAPPAYAAAILVLGAGAGTWAATRRFALLLRIGGVVFTTTEAYGEGQATCQLLAAHGLDPAFVVPAVTAVGLVTVGWWISRRTRHWWPPIAWLLRAPLGCALVAAALYH